MMTVDQAIDKAHEVVGWVENACGDMAFDIAQCGFDDGSYQKWLKAGGKNVSKDFRADAYADALYSDVDTLCDLTGDRIHDEGNGDYEDMILIAMAIQDFAQSALKKAMESHINRWISYIKAKEGK